ncbi:unnamed protein product (macronuclear) [Paramecium tetraurelia]|uniref:Response regulatory domain-containing protein n=1 Tax=Paramecium tetraurelia TaxID=5888 RepID=A0BZ71_PARTE|nr:uncharacterized protein GSPATT00033691001 [Paramecium tetraurelia]CAK63838.1 unnamed protein product [Paramecium tetraurelia]|eukprot:XP_001431236.1 hypothetical protein (macronuclear) [Paramecium tetraurelia strain d4-2]
MKIFISLITTQTISTIIAFTEFEEPKEIIALALELAGIAALFLLNKFNLPELLQRAMLLGQAILIFVLMPNSQYKYFTGAYHIIVRLKAYTQVSRLLLLEWSVLLLIVFIFGTEIEIHQIFRSIFAFLGLLIIQGFELQAWLEKYQKKPEIMIHSKILYTGYDSNPRSLTERITDPNFSILYLDDQFNAIGSEKSSSILNNLENGLKSILHDLIVHKIDSQSKSILQWKSSGCSLQDLLDQVRANRIPMIIRILDYSHPQLNSHFIKIIYQREFQIQFLELEERDRYQKQKYVFAILKQLLSTMSHEFGTSLNYLLAIAQVAIEKYSDSDLLSYFMPIKSMGLIMHNFVLDMVDYNNIKGKKLELQLEKIDISQLLEEVISIFFHTLQQKGLKITYEIFLVEKSILTDGRRLKQILVTLIQNAQKFTFSGGIKIIVKSIDQNKYVQFEISDTGIGMTKNEIEGLTEMLKYDYKKEKKISTNTAGFGLGSFLCNKIAMSLSNLKYEEGGGIRYYSSQEIKGTKVVFKIINESFNLTYTLTAPQDNSSGIIKVGRNAVFDVKQSQIEFGLNAIKNLITHKFSTIMVPKVNSFHDDHVKGHFMKRLTTKDKLGSLFKIQMQHTKKDQDSINEETNEGDYQRRLQFQNIRLPCFPQQNQSSKQNSYDEIDNVIVNCNCKQILIVDDEMINILGLQLMLKSFNLESDSSYNGQEALIKLEQAHCLYDFIFMDINMPIMDGFATTKAIIEKYKNDAPIIIACTAFTDSETKQYCYEIGMSHYISKPVNKNELQKLLSYLIN